MKKAIISRLTIDNFVRYQNGNLYISFIVESSKDVNILKYKSSKLYKKFNKNKEEIEEEIEEENDNDAEELNMDIFKQIVASFENFINFLKDDHIIIDYTYLWDIICEMTGFNLIILEIPDNDSTNNVNFICPTNHYATELYNPDKESIFLIKRDNFYEPIYQCINNSTQVLKKTAKKEPSMFTQLELSVKKTFKQNDPNISKIMKDIFEKVIVPFISTCRPLPSISPKIYRFKKPILLGHLINELNELKYTIKFQVINFNNKVIGLLVLHEHEVSGKKIKSGGFIPCFPSSINSRYETILINDDTIYKNYSNTLSFLTDVFEKSNGRIPCAPKIKVIEDEFVVGIITETNQFIQLSGSIFSGRYTR